MKKHARSFFNCYKFNVSPIQYILCGTTSIGDKKNRRQITLEKATPSRSVPSICFYFIFSSF